MQWHPDKFQDEEDKKKAEKKFMDIAAAKEVLTDEGRLICKSEALTYGQISLSEMRQKYDQGEDPLDPENGQGGGGGHPFRQGGHTFHFPGSLWYFFRLLISTSRWPSLWWRAVQVPLQLANVTGHSFIATWL